jgi:uncharacterized membrane protein
MSTASPALRRTNLLRPKYLLFGFIGLMLVYVLVNNERFLLDSSDPEWAHINSFKWYLLPHGIMAACALFLGPMQFSDRLRQRFAKFHRVVGRFYVAGVFIGAPLGFYIQYYEERMGGARSFSFAALTDAAIWMLTTAIAMYFILNGKVQQHRQWMTRSFAVAIVFPEVRVVLGITGWHSATGSNDETVVWMCVAFSLLFADVVLQWQDLSARRPAPAIVQPVPTATD